ncbi:transposase [Kitasatospora sp. NPDC004669]|uniref:RNA-guided endonuclease InsQ/TnpB family protein n=1 Tax=Kitasatospora sp. NPDC004669 TaxID=3154555 RepID=UPI0033AF02A5
MNDASTPAYSRIWFPAAVARTHAAVVRVLTVVRVELMPSPEVAAAIADTLSACNGQADRVFESAFRTGARSRKTLQGAACQELKAAGLSARPALHVIREVADAYSTLTANIRAGDLGMPGSTRRTKAGSRPVVFRFGAAQPYDDRCLSWQLDAQGVSIRTIAGRLKGVRFVCSPDALKALRKHRKGESDPVARGGEFFLIAACDIPGPEIFGPTGWIGVDFGIADIATASTGYRAAGRGLNRHRKRLRDPRAKLRKKGTKSAGRVLKRLSRKESRRAEDANHVISERIVTEAERTCAGIGVEDLSGIRRRARPRRPVGVPPAEGRGRVALHTWAFARLGSFVAYKAKWAGVPPVYVDPAYTSQACADCGHIGERNRPDRAAFACRSCGVVAHAGRSASRDIAHRAAAAWDAGRQSSAPATA